MERFSGNKDVDREILSKLDDRNLLQACQVNKYVWNQICNEDFFRNRLIKMFPEIKREDIKNWKEFYLRAIYYISKMKEDYGYVYTFGDFKKQYNLLKEYNENKDDLLIYSSRKGELALVIWSLKNGSNIYTDYALRMASEKGHLEVVKYLVSQGANIHAEDDQALRWASINGKLEVVKYLVSQGANIHADDDWALRWASANGHLEVVKYLMGKGADIHADYALRWASMYGQLEVVKYLVEQGTDIHTNNDEALREASEYGHLEVVKYLKSKMQKRKI